MSDDESPSVGGYTDLTFCVFPSLEPTPESEAALLREEQDGEDREGGPAAVRSWFLRAFNTQGAVLHRRLVHVVLISCFQNKSTEPW